MKQLPEQTEEGLEMDREPKYHDVLRSYRDLCQRSERFLLSYCVGTGNDAILGVSYQGKNTVNM
jgi:hypothetical protein